jgi:hypothetical protein
MQYIRSRPLNMLPARQQRVWPLQAALAVVVVITAAMGWSLWGPDARPGTTASIGSQLETSPLVGSSSASPNPAPAAVTSTQVTGTAPGLESDTVRFYEEHTGKSFQARLRDGSVRPLSETVLKNFVTSWWVPGYPQVISKFDDGSTVSYRHYNFTTDTSSDIGSLVTALALSPDGQSIVYAQTETGRIDIIRANADGSDSSVLLSTRALDIGLAWPAKDRIAVTLRRNPDGARDLLELHPDGTIVPLFTGMQNLETSWSRDGSWLLYSYYREEDGTALRVHSVSDGTDVDTGLLTSAAKCAWMSDGLSFVCGVPSSAALSGDVPAELTATNDSVVRVIRDSLEQAALYRAQSRPLLSVSRPFISSSGAFFVFSNLFDKKLYSFPLH